MPTPEEIKKILEEAAKEYSGLDEHFKELDEDVKTLNSNITEMNDLYSAQKNDELEEKRNVYLQNKTKTEAKSNQIVGLSAGELNTQIPSFFGGPKSADESDILDWAADNLLLFKLLINKSFKAQNSVGQLFSTDERINSAVKLATLFISKNAPELLDKDSVIEIRDENQYLADLQDNFNKLQGESRKFNQEMGFGRTIAQIKEIAEKSGVKAMPAPKRAKRMTAKTSEPGFRKPKYSYEEITGAIKSVSENADDFFKYLAGNFDVNNFLNGNADLNLKEQPMPDALLAMINELSEDKYDAEKAFGSDKDPDAIEKAYREIKSYYNGLKTNTEYYIGGHKNSTDPLVKKCVETAQMMNSYAQDMEENSRIKLQKEELISKARLQKEKELKEQKELEELSKAINAGKETQEPSKAANAVQKAEQNAGVKAPENTGKNTEAAKTTQKSDLFVDLKKNYTSFIKDLKDAKTFKNSNEYTELISKMEEMNSEKFWRKNGGADLSAQDRYVLELMTVKKLIDAYITHKGKDGVKKNVYNKLAAVEKLNTFVTDGLDQFGPDVFKDPVKPEVAGALKQYKLFADTTLHPGFTKTYTHEQAQERGNSAKEYDPSFDKDSCENTLNCMDRIIHFAKPGMKKDLVKMQKEFYYNPGNGNYQGKDDAKKALEDAEKAPHMDSALKSGLKSVVDKDEDFKFDDNNLHSELKYCYAKKTNLTVYVTHYDEDDDGKISVHTDWHEMSNADGMISAFVSKARSESGLLGSKKKFKEYRGYIVDDIKEVIKAADYELVNSLKDNLDYLTSNPTDKDLLEKWPALTVTAECYKAVLQEKDFDWGERKLGKREKAQAIVDGYAKLENRVKRLAGLTVEEPEKKAVAQPAGLIK